MNQNPQSQDVAQLGFFLKFGLELIRAAMHFFCKQNAQHDAESQNHRNHINYDTLKKTTTIFGVPVCVCASEKNRKNENKEAAETSNCPFSFQQKKERRRYVPTAFFIILFSSHLE